MSELRANTISDAAGTGPVTLTGQYAAKAWGSLQCQGTSSIRDSGNVSSLTDNGTGDFTITYTTAFSTANYAFVSAASGIDASDTARGYASGPQYSSGQTTTSTRILSSFGGGGFSGRIDYNWVNFAVLDG